MPQYISMRELNAKAQELGTVGEALRWAAANGYEVDPNGSTAELPPLPGQQPVYDEPGGLAQATAVEEPEADDEDLGAGDVDFTKLSDPAAFNQLYRQSLAQQAEYERTAAQRFAEAKARLEEKYRGPDTAEQLFSLARALVAPRDAPGFAGTIGQIAGSFEEVEKAKREADVARAEQLAALQAQYDQGRFQRAGAGQKTLTDLLGAYSKINKPVKARTGFNPITGRLVDMDSGLPVIPPPPRLGEVRDGYRYIGGDPASEKSWKKV